MKYCYVTDHKLTVDITQDKVEPHGDDDDHQYVYTQGPVLTLVIGNLSIRLTEQQEEKIREYFENT